MTVSMPGLEWRRFIVALAVTLAPLAILWTIFPPVYLTNDDVTIRLSVEGGLVPGEPRSGYALMTHAALGWTIVWISRLLPSVPLWDLVITATLVCSIAVLGALCWPVLGGNWVSRATVVAMLAIAALPLFGAMQFTFGATVAGIAGVVLAFVELGTATRARASILVAAGALFTIGVLVRPMAATAGAITAVLLLLPQAHEAKQIKRVASLAAAAIAIFACLQWIDTRLYGLSPEWDRYHRYNWMLAQLLEWGGPLARGDVEAMRASAGWTANDWSMLSGWFGIDPDLHGFSRVAQAYETQLAHAGWTDRFASLAVRAALPASERLTRLVWESGPILVAIGALALAFARRGSAFVLGGIGVLFLVLCVAIEAVFKELPFRLLAPLLVSLAIVPLIALAPQRRPSSPLIALFALSVLLAIAADRLIDTVKGLRAEQAEAVEVDGHVEQLQRLSPSLVVLHADAFPAELWWRPFRRLRTRPITIRLGDNNQNPLLLEFLSASKLQPLLRAACDDPSILIVSVEERLDPATVYLREHLQMPVAWREVYSGSFTAWRCERLDRIEIQ